MSDSRAIALQMNPFSLYLETELARRFETVRWFELDKHAQVTWLQKHASAVKAVIASGHIGCSPELTKALPSLGIIAINGVGLDKVDLALARVLSAEGRGVEARAAAQRALEQLRKALGPQHPDTRAAEQLSRADSEAPNQ